MRISSKRKVLEARQKNFIWKEVKTMNQKKTYFKTEVPLKVANKILYLAATLPELGL